MFNSSDSAFKHISDRLNPLRKSVDFDIFFLRPPSGAVKLLHLREQPFDHIGGGGQEDLSEPDNFFCLFLEQENFFRRPIIFLKPPRALFIKP